MASSDQAQAMALLWIVAVSMVAVVVAMVVLARKRPPPPPFGGPWGRDLTRDAR
jgi:hypothetical protein